MRSEAEESYLTVAEIAAVLKVNQQTVRNWIDQGRLPALRIGRRVRVRRSDLEQLLNASYAGAHPADPAPSTTAQAFWERRSAP
jgi:excisionase family DNA binding protein